MKKLSWILIILAIISLIIFVILANNRWEKDRSNKEDLSRLESLSNVNVAMKWSFSGTMSPYFAAQQNGIFEKNNLKIELLESGPGRPTSVQSVILNRASFGITGAHELAIARSQDLPVISLAVIFKQSPVCLITTIDKRINSPQDLVGRTVEMTTGDNSEFEYLAMLKESGIDPETVNQIPWQYNYQGLFTGSSDAIVCYENDQPITLRSEFIKQDKDIRLIRPRDFGVTPYADVLFTTEEMIESDPELVRRVLFAFLEAWEWSNTRIEDTVKLFLQSPQITEDEFIHEEQVTVLRKSLEFVKGYGDNIEPGHRIEEIGHQKAERWLETINLIRMYGEVEKLPDHTILFNNRWVNEYKMYKGGR